MATPRSGTALVRFKEFEFGKYWSAGFDRVTEATIAREANDLWFESLKPQFTNRPAADFTLETPNGSKITLSNLKNKVVLIDFWATWCQPCTEEILHLVELYQKYKDQGFEILAISVDAKSELYKVEPFAETHKMTFPILFDDGVSTLIEKGIPNNDFHRPKRKHSLLSFPEL